MTIAATTGPKPIAATMRRLAETEALTAEAQADDLAFAAEERRLWNPTPEMLDALVAASLEIGNAVKTGRNEHDRYDYGTLEDYLNAARKPLLEHGLLLVSRPVGDPVLSEAKAQSGSSLQIARVLVETRVIHAASKGWIAARVWGEGRDRGDKAIYKALTGGRKYALAMVLGIYTTDEPENDSPELVQPPPQQQRRREPSPPADSARPQTPPAAALAEEWSEKAQEVFVSKMAVLQGDDERTFAAKARAAADFIGQKRPAMTDAQASQAATALIARCDAVRNESPHLMTEEEAKAVFGRVTQILGLKPASEMPGAPVDDAVEHAHEMEGAAVDSGHV